MAENIYKQIVAQNIPKLINCYNTDSYSETYGYGDRLFWGWKISDFSNATLQGGCHTLAGALKLGIDFNKNIILDIIDSSIRAISKIKNKNGSLCEAYPRENSFCVTSVVAYDVLSAIDLLGSFLNKEVKNEYIEIIRPLISFITKNTEQHAIISNHLATGAAAIVLWNKISDENNVRFKDLLKIIFNHQSEEGWYLEYEGADPGYQTLCTYYLYTIYKETNDEQLKSSLQKSAEFLKYFIHPDSTIGGLYGSRNTEVYYPGGIVGLSKLSEDFRLISNLMYYGIINGKNLTPAEIDYGNFIPLLNSYCVAALEFQNNPDIILCDCKPKYYCLFEKNFFKAGIHIKSTNEYYSIINYKKGGTLKVFDKNTGKLDIEDGGIFGTYKNGKKFSTQVYDNKQTFENCVIKSKFYQVNESYPSPGKFLIVRILSLTIFRSILLGEIFKKIIVNILMTGKKKIDGKVIRTFKLNDKNIIVEEQIIKPIGCKTIAHSGKIKSIHMASSGYYIKQMQEKPVESKRVKFI